MSDIDSKIKTHVDAFVMELSSLVRQAALEAVATALRGGAAAPSAPAAKPAAAAPRKVGRPPKAKVEAAPAAKAEAPRKAAAPAKPAAKPSAAAAAAAKRKPGAKRSPEEIAGTTDSLFAHIQAHPGERIEEISKILNISTKELTLPVKKLLSDKRITSRGTRRATKYFPR